MNQLNRFCLILGPLWAVQLAGPVCADPQSPDDSMRVRAVSTIRSVGSRTGAPRSGGVNFRDQDAALPSSLSRGSVGQTPPDRARDPNEPLPLVRFTPVQTPDRSAPVRASGAASIPMGNHKEAHAGAASCLGLYTMYAARSQGLDGLSGTRVYLKLLAPESAELEREQIGRAHV